MSNIKFFFTFILLFSFGITQAQIIDSAPLQEETITKVETAKINNIQVKAELSVATDNEINTNTNTNTTVTTEPANPNITTNPDAFVFYFKYKQYLKPVVRKSALC